MTNKFKLHVHLSQIEHLLNLEETLRIVSESDPLPIRIADENLLANQLSLKTIKSIMLESHGLNYAESIEGVYFGQETCEKLIPSIKDMQAAVSYCLEKQYSFTFATPYVGPHGMQKLLQLFDYLQLEASGSEVVVNDFGVLHQLCKNYKDLSPTLGRLLVKTKRDPRYSISGFEAAETDINDMKVVEKNQAETIQSSALELTEYQSFLRLKGVKRICIDSPSPGFNEKLWAGNLLPVDLYWPWAYITSSRSCPVAAITQPGKESHPTEEHCKYQCRKFGFGFKSDKKMLPTVLRGNAVWMNTTSQFESSLRFSFDRLIYQPYVPV